MEVSTEDNRRRPELLHLEPSPTPVPATQEDTLQASNKTRKEVQLSTGHKSVT